MEQIKCLIVDDEPYARKGLEEHLEHIDFLKHVGSCNSAIQATSYLQDMDIDLLFLDIQMPKVSGIDFIRNLSNPPLVIFTTAYPEYAIESYELDIVDYLLKPTSFSRFFKAAVKAKGIFNQQPHSNAENQSFFFVKCSQKIEKIIIKDIIYVESMVNYVIIHTLHHKYITYLTFKSVIDQLPRGQFIRIHRSFIVALKSIQTIDGNEVVGEKSKLPISKNYKDEVMEMVEKYMFKR